MYKVLIVDDESYIIKSLIATIDWNQYGFQLAGQASNGIEALEAIMNVKPDLVFTDVKMPGMGGLELIKTASEKQRNILFVVISGYAEFAYAQKAMNYGALGYCLKPFEDNEIISVLLKARSILDMNKSSMEVRLMELLEEQTAEGRRQTREAFESFGFEEGSGQPFLVMASVGGGKWTVPSHLKHINLKIGSNKNAYLLEFGQAVHIKEFVAGSFPDSVRGIGMYASPCACDSVKSAIDQSVVAAYQFFLTGKRGLYETGSGNPEPSNPSILQLEKAIDNKESTQIQRVLDSMNRSAHSMDIKHALRVYNMVMSFLYRLDTVKYEDYIYNYEQLTNLFVNFGQMLDYLKELLVKQINAGGGPFPKDVRNETFRSILQHVNENYFEDISIQSISQTFKINPSYVSQLFKKELDITFTDYLTRMRISFASNLLKTTSLPVNEIAERAGYDEYYYFTRVFKKVTGKTPTEFRS